uniref:Transposase Tc1-like domain-containing protein n=1 Tax=Leptobrachium leishanense TaxID=445787 RepID=A0A8C5PHP2_9ANUR
MTATQPRSGRPRKLMERGQRMLRRIVRRGLQLSAESIARDLQTACGLQISSMTVRRELHGMGFHGRAAASKPYITKCNAKRRMQWCKARRHWTLEQWRRILWSDESSFSIWQSDGRVWVWRLPGKSLAADCAVGSSLFTLLLYHRSLCQHSFLEIFSSDWRHFSHFPLEIISVPVGFVVRSLNIRI